MALIKRVHSTQSDVDQEFLHLDAVKEPAIVVASRAPTSSDRGEPRIWFYDDGTNLKVYFRGKLKGWTLGLTL